MTYLVFFLPGTNVTQDGNSISTNLNNTLNTTNNGVFLGNFRVNPMQLTETGNILVLLLRSSILCCGNNKVITVPHKNLIQTTREIL